MIRLITKFKSLESHFFNSLKLIDFIFFSEILNINLSKYLEIGVLISSLTLQDSIKSNL